jgi:hypothetical protein
MSGVRFNEQMMGWLAVPRLDRSDTGQGWFRLRAAVIIPDIGRFLADSSHRGTLEGHIDFLPLGSDLAARGHVELFAPALEPHARVMRYQASFTAGGHEYEMIGTKYVGKKAGYNAWAHTTTLYTTVLQRDADGMHPIAAGTIRLTICQGVRMLLTLRSTMGTGVSLAFKPVARFAWFFIAEVTGAYLPRRKP